MYFISFTLYHCKSVFAYILMHDVDIAIYLYFWNILITNRQNCMERELTLFNWIFICICIKLKFYWQLLLFTAGHLKLNFFFFIKNDAYYIIPVHVSFTFLFLLEIKQGQKPLVWGEPESSTKKSILTPWKKMTSMVRTSSNLSSTSSKRAYKPTSRRSTPNTPTKYERKTHNLI